jgi:hypothetical protein
VTASIEVLTTVKTRESRFGPAGIEIWRRQGLSVGTQPAWFRRIVDRDFGGSFNADWFDHFAKNGEQLVVEPYNLSHKDLRDLIAFADKYSLGVSMSAVSHHFPTRTISIELTPRGER